MRFRRTAIGKPVALPSLNLGGSSRGTDPPPRPTSPRGSDDDPVVPTRLSRSVATLSRRLRVLVGRSWRSAARRVWSSNPAVARPAGLAPQWFGQLPVRSPLLRGWSLFLGVHEMFQVPRCPPPHKEAVIAREAIGLPHSEIVGSRPARGSPTLIAALPRPSSARSAEASTRRSLCLPCGNPQGDARRYSVATLCTCKGPD
jgi:hypothetical protein